MPNKNTEYYIILPGASNQAMRRILGEEKRKPKFEASRYSVPLWHAWLWLSAGLALLGFLAYATIIEG